MILLPRYEASGNPLGGKGYVATCPTCEPPLILPPRYEAVWTPKAAGVM